MAGLLNAQFACYVRVNFESAFYPAWQKKSRLPFFPRHIQFFPGLKEGISNGTQSINIFKRELVAR
jgi:hypothetical protein